MPRMAYVRVRHAGGCSVHGARLILVPRAYRSSVDFSLQGSRASARLGIILIVDDVQPFARSPTLCVFLLPESRRSVAVCYFARAEATADPWEGRAKTRGGAIIFTIGATATKGWSSDRNVSPTSSRLERD